LFAALGGKSGACRFLLGLGFGWHDLLLTSVSMRAIMKYKCGSIPSDVASFTVAHPTLARAARGARGNLCGRGEPLPAQGVSPSTRFAMQQPSASAGTMRRSPSRQQQHDKPQ
jgi:hypothetical protein